MSILIKGISMPKYGELSITIDALGGVAYTDRDMKVHDVIEVPTPHGDLVDRDVVRRKYQKMATDAYIVNIKAKMETVINACIDQLEYAQTVIESEE